MTTFNASTKIPTTAAIRTRQRSSSGDRPHVGGGEPAKHDA